MDDSFLSSQKLKVKPAVKQHIESETKLTIPDPNTDEFQVFLEDLRDTYPDLAVTLSDPASFEVPNVVHPAKQQVKAAERRAWWRRLYEKVFFYVDEQGELIFAKRRIFTTGSIVLGALMLFVYIPLKLMGGGPEVEVSETPPSELVSAIAPDEAEADDSRVIPFPDARVTRREVEVEGPTADTPPPQQGSRAGFLAPNTQQLRSAVPAGTGTSAARQPAGVGSSTGSAPVQDELSPTMRTSYLPPAGANTMRSDGGSGRAAPGNPSPFGSPSDNAQGSMSMRAGTPAQEEINANMTVGVTSEQASEELSTSMRAEAPASASASRATSDPRLMNVSQATPPRSNPALPGLPTPPSSLPTNAQPSPTSGSQPQTSAQAAPDTSNVNLQPGMRVQATLATGVALVVDKPMPVVAESKGDWCTPTPCPTLSWIGEATLDTNYRVQATFTQLRVNGGAPQPVLAMALDAVTHSAGLVPRINDASPSVTQDLLRAAAGGAADHLDALANQQKVSIVDGVATTERTAPSLENFLLGRAAGLFDLPSDSTTVVRSGVIERHTPFVLLYGVGAQ